MNDVKNILVLQSMIEILVTMPGLGHGVPVCVFHTRPIFSGCEVAINRTQADMTFWDFYAPNGDYLVQTLILKVAGKYMVAYFCHEIAR